MAEAENGDKFELLGDITDVGNATVNKQITFDGKNKTITTSGSNNLMKFTASGITLKNININKTDKVSQDILNVGAASTTLDSIHITGDYQLGDPQVSRGMVVATGNDGLTVKNSSFEHLRQPAYINGQVTNATIENNYLAHSRGWVVVGDAEVTFTGNTWGTGADANAVDIAIIDNSPSIPEANIYFKCLVMNALKANNNNPNVDNQVFQGDCVVHNVTQNKSYGSLKAAVNAAVSGDKLILLEDIEVSNIASERISITKKLIIDGQGHQISANVSGSYGLNGPFQISGNLSTQDASGSTFKNFSLVRTGAGDAQGYFFRIFANTTDLTFDNIEFVGTSGPEGLGGNDNNYQWVFSGFENCTDLVITNSSFKNFHNVGFLRTGSTGEISNNTYENTLGWNILADTEFEITGNIWPNEGKSFVNIIGQFLNGSWVDHPNTYYTCQKIAQIKVNNGGTNDDTVYEYSFDNVRNRYIYSSYPIIEVDEVEFLQGCSVINITKTTRHNTIQEAINSADENDVIEVGFGTYTENVTVNKAVTIKGANAGISAGSSPGTRSDETIIDGAVYFTKAATLDGFTIINGVKMGGSPNKDGILVASAGVTVINSIIKDVIGSQNTGIQVGYHNNFTLTNSSVINNWRGIYLNPSSGHVLSGNLIDGNDYGISSDGLTNFSMTNSTISKNSGEGWGASDVGEDVVANGNTFSENGVSIAHYGGNPIDATGNFWDETDYSTILDKAVSGAVVFVPYNSSSTTSKDLTNAKPDNLTLIYTAANQDILVQLDVKDNDLQLQPIAGVLTQAEIETLYQNLNTALSNTNQEAIQNEALALGDDIIIEYYYMNGANKVYLKTVAENPLVKNKYWDQYLVRDSERLPDWNSSKTKIDVNSYRSHTNPATGSVSDGWLDDVLGNDLYVTVTFVHNGTVNSVTETVAIAEGPVKNTNTGKTYSSIQKAIDDANPAGGDVIEVAAGIFNESININKPLTLKGAKFGVDPRPFASSSRSIGGTDETIVTAALNKNVVSITSGGVVFDGFQVTQSGGSGTADAIKASTALDGVTLINNIVNAATDEAIQLESGKNYLIQYNYIYESKGDGVTLSSYNVSPIKGENLKILDNEFKDIQSSYGAIYLYGVKDVEIAGNLINTQGSGIKLGSGGFDDLPTDNIDVHHNTIITALRTAYAGTVDGITIDGAGNGIRIRNNIIQQSGTNNIAAGNEDKYTLLRVGFTGGTNSHDPSNLSIENNHFSRSDRQENFIYIESTINNPIYAYCNWFGTTDLSEISNLIEDKSSSNFISGVTYLTSGNNTLTSGTGFEPETNACFTPVYNETKQKYFSTIQGAIDAAITQNGDVIKVSAGTYAENIVITKELDIRGPNYGVSPNSGTRSDEAVLIPAESKTDASIRIQASNVSINGFLIDGDNTSITTGWEGTNEADIDAYSGISTADAGNSLVINGLKVENNIFQNFQYFAIEHFGWYNYNNPATNGHLFNDNLFKDLGTYNAENGYDNWGGAILIYNNNYTHITNNVIENVRVGIQTGNFQKANTGDSDYQIIEGNTIEARAIGIFYNLQNHSPFTVKNNTITANYNPYELSASTRAWNGILVASLGNNMGESLIEGNNVDGSGLTSVWTRGSDGINVWNVKVDAPAKVSGGTIKNVDRGVFFNNFEGYNSDGSYGAHGTVTGVTITNAQAGILVHDSPSSTSHAAVSATIENNFIEAKEGVVFAEDQSGKVSGSVNENHITEFTSYAINSSVDNTIDANCNWYGSSSFGDVQAAISGNVVYNTYLSSDDNSGSVGFVPDGDCIGPVKNIDTGKTYSTIQAAIDASETEDSHTIEVSDGTYTENVAINKDITLTSVNGSSFTTIAPASGRAVELKGDSYKLKNITVKGFTLNVTGAAIALQSNSQISNGYDVDGLTYEDLVINAPDGYAIGLFDVQNVTLDNVTIADANNGIEMIGVNNMTIKNSAITGSNKKAINLGRATGYENNSNITITNSTISGGKTNVVAIDMKSVTGTLTLEGNDISENAGYGFRIDNDPTDAELTLTISENTFTNNGGVAVYLEDDNLPNVKITALVKDNTFDGNRKALGSELIDNLEITGNLFHNSTQNAVEIGVENVLIENNSFEDNLESNLLAFSGYSFDADNNWWGTTSISDINAKISGNVTYCTFLDSGDNDATGPGFIPKGDNVEKLEIAEGTISESICYDEDLNLKLDLKEYGGTVDWTGEVTVKLYVTDAASNPHTFVKTATGGDWGSGINIEPGSTSFIGENTITGMDILYEDCEINLTQTDIEDLLGTDEFTVNPEPKINFTINHDQSIKTIIKDAAFDYCDGETVTVKYTSSGKVGTAPFTIKYTIDDEDEQTAVAQTNGDALFTGLQLDAGTHTVEFTSITDANGCSISEESLKDYKFTIIIKDLPKAPNQIENIKVYNTNEIGKITFTSENSGDVTYHWTNDKTNIGLGASGDGEIVAFNTNATNDVIGATISVVAEVGGCTSEPMTFTITVLPTPEISPNEATICSGQSVDLVINCEIGSPVWSIATDDIGDTAGRREITVSPNSNETIYTAYCADENGNSKESETKVKVLASPAAPQIISGSDLVVCKGTEVTLNISHNCESGYIQWNDMSEPTAASTTRKFKPSEGEFEYKVKCINDDELLCDSDWSNGFVITVNDINLGAPSTNGDHYISKGASVVLEASCETGSFPVWFDGLGNIAAAGNSNEGEFTTPNLSVNTTYTVYCMVDQVNPNNCKSTGVSQTITMDNFALVSNPKEIYVCLGQDAFFVVGATGRSVSYQWQVDDGNGWVDLANVEGLYRGVNTNNLILIAPSIEKSEYRYRCVIKSGLTPFEEIASHPAKLTVLESAIAHQLEMISPISGVERMYQAVDIIEGTNKIKDGAKVKYFAGNSITLEPGFEVEPGSVFTAKIQIPCTNTSFNAEIPLKMKK